MAQSNVSGDDILNVAEQHFKAKLDNSLMYQVDVPEWKVNGKPVQMFFKPPTLAERDQIFQCIRKGTLESVAQTIVTRARNSKGELLFRQVHLTQFMRMVDSNVLDRILEKLALQEGISSAFEIAQANEPEK